MSLLTVKPEKLIYPGLRSEEFDDNQKTNLNNNWKAKLQGFFFSLFPAWKKWNSIVIPFIYGNKILEVSFGNGYLMTQYGKEGYEIHGVENDKKMIEKARKKLGSKNITANLYFADVEKLPFPDESFDTVINTMSFTCYDDGEKAMFELKRVLKRGGTLLLVDFDYPACRNILGYWIIKLWQRMGDIIKNINNLLQKYNFEYRDIPIGACGSVHFFIARRR